MDSRSYFLVTPLSERFFIDQYRIVEENHKGYLSKFLLRIA